MILAIIGIIPTYVGFTKLNEAQSEEDRIIEKNEFTNVPEIKTVSGNSASFSAVVGNEPIFTSYAFKFTTDDVFAVDNRIEYKVDLHVSNPDLIRDVVLIFGIRGEDYTGVAISNVDSFVETRSRLFGDTIKLLRDDDNPNLFTRSGNIIFPLEGNLRLYFITIDKNGGSGTLPFDDPVFTISPPLAKLQADTNRATLDQINELKESTKSQNVSNKRIEGLTWITVGAIPILVCADILLRVYFDLKKDRLVFP